MGWREIRDGGRESSGLQTLGIVGLGLMYFAVLGLGILAVCGR